MTQTLQIFALNEPVEVSHTNLTRQKGQTPDLPPLTEWLGVPTLDTDAIELFPIDDLGTMALSDYIQLAFAPEDPIPGDIQTRLNALKGAVLLVPDAALTAPTAPGPQATAIATLRLASADNTARLPKADVIRTPPPTPAPQDPESAPPIAFFALVGMAILALIIIFVGWA